MNFIYNSPLKLNIPCLPFGIKKPLVQKPNLQINNDGFATNPIYDKFGTKVDIEQAAKNSPRIMAIMDKYSLPLKVNINELENLKQGHMRETRIVAAKIYSALPEELKKEVNLPALQEAAMFHDYGKVLIPEEILNKKGRLTPLEREVMENHSEFGYELLKNKGLSEKTLNLIKHHHQNLKSTGYPQVEKDFKYDIDSQILNVADKYTALREKRSYKSPIAKYEAFEIIAKDVNDGNISQEVYTALIKGV